MAGSTSSELSAVARPYAEAVFKRAKETGEQQAWSDALAFLSAVTSNRSVLGLLANPTLTRARLTELFFDIGDGKLSEEAQNLVRLVVENGRAAALPEIAGEYEALRSEDESRVDVEVTAAYSVSAAQKKKIAEAMKKRLGKDVRITTQRDNNLIGGAVIRAGDLVIDGSVRGKLEQLATGLNT